MTFIIQAFLKTVRAPHNNNNKNIAAVNDSSNDKLQPDIISATKQTTKRCVNNNCLSITPNFSTTVKNATGKESVAAPKLAYKVNTR